MLIFVVIDRFAILALTLLQLRVLFINDVNLSFATNDLAIHRTFLHGCSDFHYVSVCGTGHPTDLGAGYTFPNSTKYEPAPSRSQRNIPVGCANAYL